MAKNLEIIIHHYIELRQMTSCGKQTTSDPGQRNAVDLAHAIRQIEYMSFNQNPQLCRGCWEHQVEKLQDMLTEPDDEIVEEG